MNELLDEIFVKIKHFVIILQYIKYIYNGNKI